MIALDTASSTTPLGPGEAAVEARPDSRVTAVASVPGGVAMTTDPDHSSQPLQVNPHGNSTVTTESTVTPCPGHRDLPSFCPSTAGRPRIVASCSAGRRTFAASCVVLRRTMAEPRKLQNFVAGEYADAADGRELDLVDPSTGQVFATAPIAGEADVDRACNAAAAAFEGWSNATPAERSLALLKIADAF